MSLISPDGVFVGGVGTIHSPFIRDIFKIGYDSYKYCIGLLLMQPSDYFKMKTLEAGIKQNPYDLLSDDDKKKFTSFSVLTGNKNDRVELMLALSLFISGSISWDEEYHAFLINKTEQEGKISVDGVVSKDTFSTVCKICLAMIGVKPKERVEDLKFKNENARKFYERFQAKKEKAEAQKPSDPDFELPNMISVICAYHSSLNYSNIASLTIYQVQDTFSRMIRKKQMDIRDMNYSVWGGKDYDPKKWIERMDKEE